MEKGFLEEQLTILTKQTLDIFLKQKNPAEMIALYVFYYYTAKWQDTNKIFCTTEYAAKGLNISPAKVRKIKQGLIQLGLVEDVSERDEKGKLIGHYIRINYCLSQKNHPHENPQCGKTSRVDNPQCGKTTDKCLLTNKENALKTGNKNIEPPRHKYGSYENVLLSDEEVSKLKQSFPYDWQKRIEKLSGYIASKGVKYKSHYATICVWARREADVAEEKNKFTAFAGSHPNADELEKLSRRRE